MISISGCIGFNLKAMKINEEIKTNRRKKQGKKSFYTNIANIRFKKNSTERILAFTFIQVKQHNNLSIFFFVIFRYFFFYFTRTSRILFYFCHALSLFIRTLTQTKWWRWKKMVLHSGHSGERENFFTWNCFQTHTGETIFH